MASGVLIESWCLSLNPFHHCFPAFLFTYQECGIDNLFAVANEKQVLCIFHLTVQGTYQPSAQCEMITVVPFLII